MRKQSYISYAGTDRFPAPMLKEVFYDSFAVFRSIGKSDDYVEYDLEKIPAELREKPWNKYAQ